MLILVLLLVLLAVAVSIGFVIGGCWVVALESSIYKSEPPSMRPDFRPKPMPDKYKDGSVPWSKDFTDAPWTDIRS